MIESKSLRDYPENIDQLERDELIEFFRLFQLTPAQYYAYRACELVLEFTQEAFPGFKRKRLLIKNQEFLDTVRELGKVYSKLNLDNPKLPSNAEQAIERLLFFLSEPEILKTSAVGSERWAELYAEVRELIAKLDEERAKISWVKTLLQQQFTSAVEPVIVGGYTYLQREKKSYLMPTLPVKACVELAVLRNELFDSWSTERLEAYLESYANLAAHHNYAEWMARAEEMMGKEVSLEKAQRDTDELELQGIILAVS